MMRKYTKHANNTPKTVYILSRETLTSTLVMVNNWYTMQLGRILKNHPFYPSDCYSSSDSV